MRRATKNKINIPANYSVTMAILDILYDFGENFPLLESPRRKFYHWWSGIPKPPMWRYERAMKYLEAIGKVKTFERDGKIFIKLTRKGKIQALLNKLADEFKVTPKWDDKWRVIIWDIPESSNHQRDRIRRFLKDLGFYPLQKSVYITPYPLPKSAVEYLKDSELLQFLRFLRVDKIDDDKFLTKHFKLNK